MADYVESFYRDSRRTALYPTPALAGAQRADVAVVGGGVTGCSATLHLAERGYDVALVEANRVGWGASGRSGGQILTGFGAELSAIAKSVGQDAAVQAWQVSREAVALTVERIERHAIDCDFKRGAVYAANKKRHLNDFARFRDEMAKVYGYAGLAWLDRDALYERVRTSSYLGGLYESECGHLQPLDYTLGLARAAQEAGAHIYEGSPVEDLAHGDPARLATANGVLEARYVVLAGNAYLSAKLAPELRGKLMPIGNYIATSEPLSQRQVAATLPHDDAVSDANFVLDYYHLSSDQRMLYGGQVSYRDREPRRLRERMARKLGRLFPVLKDIRIDYLWQGTVGVTLDRAPHLGRVDDNVYFAQGYSGHGMAFAGMSGKLMAEAISGQAERFDLFARLRHRRFPGGERLRTPLLVLATTFYRMRDLL